MIFVIGVVALPSPNLHPKPSDDGSSSPAYHNGYRPSYNQGGAYDQAAERDIENLRNNGTYSRQAADTIRGFYRSGREIDEKRRREMP